MNRKGNIIMKLAVGLLGVFLAQGISWGAVDDFTVMTRNLYLGANLTPAMEARDGEEFVAAVSTILETIALNNFPERAEALAAEIAGKRPHLVGLQEVYDFTLNGNNLAPPFRDHLADLLAALQARGADYRVAAVVNELNLQLPFAGNLVGVLDRDVILARSDVETQAIDFGEACRVSEDGCNYQVVAAIPNPLGSAFPPISIERGFVGVAAQLPGGGGFAFVTTHLEVREVGPFGVLQALQAQELLGFLGGLNVPVILVGDFNSDPRDPINGPFVPPYTQLAAAGYADAWLQQRPDNPNGFTCCQDEDLFNPQSSLYERVDLILSSAPPFKAKVEILDDQVADKTSPSGLWPSDHAGVAARLRLVH